MFWDIRRSIRTSMCDYISPWFYCPSKVEKNVITIIIFIRIIIMCVRLVSIFHCFRPQVCWTCRFAPWTMTAISPTRATPSSSRPTPSTRRRCSASPSTPSTSTRSSTPSTPSPASSTSQASPATPSWRGPSPKSAWVRVQFGYMTLWVCRWIAWTSTCIKGTGSRWAVLFINTSNTVYENLRFQNDIQNLTRNSCILIILLFKISKCLCVGFFSNTPYFLYFSWSR